MGSDFTYGGDEQQAASGGNSSTSTTSGSSSTSNQTSSGDDFDDDEDSESAMEFDLDVDEIMTKAMENMLYTAIAGGVVLLLLFICCICCCCCCCKKRKTKIGDVETLSQVTDNVSSPHVLPHRPSLAPSHVPKTPSRDTKATIDNDFRSSDGNMNGMSALQDMSDDDGPLKK